jgi:hypothetical protein
MPYPIAPNEVPGKLRSTIAANHPRSAPSTFGKGLKKQSAAQMLRDWRDR